MSYAIKLNTAQRYGQNLSLEIRGSLMAYAVAMNAGQKKEMVKAAQQYFSATMTPDVAARSMESSILMYKGGRGKVQVQVIFDTNTFWLSQQRMAELFGGDVRTVNYHLKQIGESGEILF